jgi:hypothetical protein
MPTAIIDINALKGGLALTLPTEVKSALEILASAFVEGIKKLEPEFPKQKRFIEYMAGGSK